LKSIALHGQNNQTQLKYNLATKYEVYSDHLIEKTKICILLFSLMKIEKRINRDTYNIHNIKRQQPFRGADGR